MLGWYGRAREDLQNNLRWQRGPVILETVRSVLHTGPRAGLLSAECFAQRNVTTVGKSLVRVGTVAHCCTVPITATGAAGRYRRGGSRRRCRRCYPCRIHGRRYSVGRRGTRCRPVISRCCVRLCFDDHLRCLANTTLIIRDHERGIFLFGDAHVVASIGLFHYMSWSCVQKYTIGARIMWRPFITYL